MQFHIKLNPDFKKEEKRNAKAIAETAFQQETGT